MVRLRDRLGLPRLVFVAAGHRAPVPLDLESLAAVLVLDRLLRDSVTGPGEVARAGPELVATEMLPQPSDLAVVDHTGDPLVAGLLLRLPGTETPEAMAARLAGRLRPRPGGQGPDREPPAHERAGITARGKERP